MYDNNFGQPYSFSTEPNFQNPQYPEPPKPPKKKKVSGGLIAGLLVAAMVIGGASGFGGSYLATRMESSSVVENDGKGSGNNDDSNKDGDDTAESETKAPETTAPEYTKPSTPVSDDLSTLANMAEINVSVKYDCEELYRQVNESIVMVYNYIQNQYGGDGYVKSGVGSGVIFTTDGYIVTNNHVVKDAAKITVVVTDSVTKNEDVEMDAVLVGTDSATDLAVLKIERNEAFVAAALGSSSDLNVGQEICVIGNPSGLSKSLSNGIISGLNRYTSEESYELSSIQTNAAINPGNSGGGLFDMYGNLVGVVNSKLISSSGDTSIENLGFAIAIDEAKPIISDLINYGYITGRPILGISTREVSAFNSGATGLLVAEINEDAPVSRSGLRIGDIITAINGEPVSSVTDVQNATKGMHKGDTIIATVERPTTTGNGYFAHTTYETIEIEIILTENEGN